MFIMWKYFLQKSTRVQTDQFEARYGGQLLKKTILTDRVVLRKVVWGLVSDRRMGFFWSLVVKNVAFCLPCGSIFSDLGGLTNLGICRRRLSSSSPKFSGKKVGLKTSKKAQ